MGVFKFLALCAGALACLSSQADSYERGGASCDSFSEAERKYQENPDNIYAQTDYGLCLIVAGQDEEGVAHLKSAGDKGDILAVFDRAYHYQTGGTWNSQVLEPNNIQQAIDLYLQVTQMIQNYHGYPIGGDMSSVEREHSIEMRSSYIVPRLYYAKFFRGALGAQSYRNNNSQEGEKTYPLYREHTNDSLQKVIHYADICLEAPLESYFDESKYHQYQSLCRIYRSAAEDILNQGLNAERLRLVNDPTCYRDLNNCEQYQVVVGKIKKILHRVNMQTVATWNSG